MSVRIDSLPAAKGQGRISNLEGESGIVNKDIQTAVFLHQMLLQCNDCGFVSDICCEKLYIGTSLLLQMGAGLFTISRTATLKYAVLHAMSFLGKHYLVIT